MKEIGTISISNREQSPMVEDNFRSIAESLSFPKDEIETLTRVLSSTTREICQKTQPLNIRLFVGLTWERFFYVEFETNKPVLLSKENEAMSFFKDFKRTETSGGRHCVCVRYPLPSDCENLDEDDLEKIRTEVLWRREREVLSLIDGSNEELVGMRDMLDSLQSELLDRTQRIAKVGGWEIQLDTMTLTWTEEVYHIHELPVTEKPKVEDGINFYAPEARPIITQAVNEAISEGKPWDLELPFITAKGNRKWVRAIGYPQTLNGKTIRLSGVFQDLTKKRESDLLLEKAIEDLQFKNKELEQFVYVASHDLQEPLRTMNSYVDLINKRYRNSLDSKAHRFLDHISNASQRMKSLIQDLLDYSRVGREASYRRVDCQAMVDSITQDLELSIKEADAEIAYSNLPEVVALDTELTRLFMNLISNGIKFRRPDARPVIEISCSTSEDSYCFCVSDNGIGMESEHLERIFTIFQRLHTRDEYPGTGIGLALCKKIVSMHEGEIWAESTPGKGSRFCFTIERNLNESELAKL